MSKFEELMENEEFITKLRECDTDEKVAKLYEEYNVEFEDNESEEIFETELKNVAGGKSDISADLLKAILGCCKSVFRSTTSYGVIMLAWYDAMRGNVTKHYTEEQIRKAASNLGVGWMIK